MDGKYYNLWSTDNDKTVPNDEVVIKSVYDPSPVGYSLPASNAFTGFTTTGQNVGSPPPAIPFNIDRINAKSPFDNGWYFYTKKDKQGETFFFPASGCRYYSSGFVRSNSLSGSYWNAGAGNSPYGISLVSYYGDIFPIYASYRNLGFPVRSAEEKVRRKILRRINFLSSQWGQHKCHRSVCMRNRPRRSVSYGKQAHSFDLCLLYWIVL